MKKMLILTTLILYKLITCDIIMLYVTDKLGYLYMNQLSTKLSS